jgi:hypothetical protein
MLRRRAAIEPCLPRRGRAAALSEIARNLCHGWCAGQSAFGAAVRRGGEAVGLRPISNGGCAAPANRRCLDRTAPMHPPVRGDRRRSVAPVPQGWLRVAGEPFSEIRARGVRGRHSSFPPGRCSPQTTAPRPTSSPASSSGMAVQSRASSFGRPRRDLAPAGWGSSFGGEPA